MATLAERALARDDVRLDAADEGRPSNERGSLTPEARAACTVAASSVCASQRP